jgi:hypothetical protein
VGAQIGGDERELFGYLIAGLIVVIHTTAKGLEALGESDVLVNIHISLHFIFVYYHKPELNSSPEFDPSTEKLACQQELSIELRFTFPTVMTELIERQDEVLGLNKAESEFTEHFNLQFQ